MMGVAAHVFDGAPPPPELKRALNYQSWGAVDVMMLPAGMLGKMNTALSIYRAISAYRQAAAQVKTVEFSKNNPREWEIASWVIAERKRLNNVDK
jgi:hypothetical protein